MESAELVARLEQVERKLALYDFIASYGPAVDSGAADATAEMWAEAGTYDFGDPAHVLGSREAMRAMVEGRAHQSLIAHGAAHFIGFPKVEIDGDTAVVTGYSQVCRFVDDHFELWRVSANRWELTWTGDGWQVVMRTAYPLDGSEAARALLRPGTP